MDEDIVEKADNSNVEPAEDVDYSKVPTASIDEIHVFQFEIGPAILRQLLEKLPKLPAEPLTPRVKASNAGFYQLIYKGREVYIGKTSRPIEQRLREHYSKLQCRSGLNIDDVYCRYAFVLDASLVDLSESELIKEFARASKADWNTTGFGSKVTGFGRKGQEQSSWQKEFPPDLGATITISNQRPLTLVQLIAELNRRAPITISIPKRVGQNRNVKSDFQREHTDAVSAARDTMSTKEWLDFIERFLMPGWKFEQYQEAIYIVPVRAGA